ncbi:hypothetical protein ABTK34_19225, partial [Acinetobacter baumannii]
GTLCGQIEAQAQAAAGGADDKQDQGRPHARRMQDPPLAFATSGIVMRAERRTGADISGAASSKRQAPEESHPLRLGQRISMMDVVQTICSFNA